MARSHDTGLLRVVEHGQRAPVGEAPPVHGPKLVAAFIEGHTFVEVTDRGDGELGRRAVADTVVRQAAPGAHGGGGLGVVEAEEALARRVVFARDGEGHLLAAAACAPEKLARR